jgi:hypothetical protein
VAKGRWQKGSPTTTWPALSHLFYIYRERATREARGGTRIRCVYADDLASQWPRDRETAAHLCQWTGWSARPFRAGIYRDTPTPGVEGGAGGGGARVLRRRGRGRGGRGCRRGRARDGAADDGVTKRDTEEDVVECVVFACVRFTNARRLCGELWTG